MAWQNPYPKDLPIREITMKSFVIICFLISSLLFLSCKKENSPVSASTQQKIMLIAGYGSVIDSSFYRVWSDSSWEKFNQIVTINGTTYYTVITNDGYESYYSMLGYAGFKEQGGSLSLFNTPIASLPDTVIFTQTYTSETSFSYQGNSYSLKIEQSLQDTVSVSVPFGTFDPCLWLKSKSTVSTAVESQVQNIQSWLAKGPSEIKQTLNSGVTITMVRGMVNGKWWGMPHTKGLPAVTKSESSKFVEHLLKPLFRGWHLSELARHGIIPAK